MESCVKHVKFVLFSLQPRTTNLLNGLSSCNAYNAKQLSAAWDVDQTCEYELLLFCVVLTFCLRDVILHCVSEKKGDLEFCQ